MPYKKSFNLNKDEKKTKSSERLYQPKKFRWCKYIVLPLLIGFILLLILTNVDFTGEAYSRDLVQTNARINSIDETIKETLSRIDLSLSRAVNCLASTDSCSLTCSGGNVNNLHKDLEPLYKSCQRDLDLILIDCSIPSGRLKYNFFAGNYRLKSVSINNCNLNAIESKVFEEKSVKNLQNLSLIKTQFESLGATSFEGLLQLEYFYLKNKISWANFKGESFLTPFAKSLTTLFLQQDSSMDITYDPLKWLQGDNMMSLKNVTLANNNFGALLQQKTFSTLIKVEYLDLSNSGLKYLPSNTFDAIRQTLKYLDLKSNPLISLAGEMLLQMSGLELNLSFNKWDCSCNNKDMLQILQWHLVDIVYIDRAAIKCYTPVEERNRLIDEVKLDCLIRTTSDGSATTIWDQNERETDQTIAIITTTIITNQTTKSSTAASSSSSSSDSTSSGSSETSESAISTKSSETSHEIETIKTTTTSMTPMTEASDSTSSTKSSETSHEIQTTTTTTTTATPPPLPPSDKSIIYCLNTNKHVYAHPIVKAKCQFSIKPLSATSVQIFIPIQVYHNMNVGILYFRDVRNITMISNLQQEHQQNEYFFLINHLKPKSTYIFCVLEQYKTSNDKEAYNWYISPLDCRSYSHSEAVVQPWLEKEDQAWIISLVVLGTCLMLLLGIILMLVFMRWRKRNLKRKQRALNDDLEMYLQGYQTPAVKPYPPRVLPPDVVQHINCHDAHDLYEELIM